MFLRSEISVVGRTSPNTCKVSEDISLPDSCHSSCITAGPRPLGVQTWPGAPSEQLQSLASCGPWSCSRCSAQGLPRCRPPGCGAFPHRGPLFLSRALTFRHIPHCLCAGGVSRFCLLSPWWVPLGPRRWPTLTLADARPFHLVLVPRFLPGAVHHF